MRKLLFYFLVLLLAVWGGLKIAADPGYLLVAYQKTTVEMPLWLAIAAIIAIFVVLYGCLRIISNIRSLGARFRAWSRQRRVRRAWQRTHRGLIALAAGEWKLAEKDLIRAAPYTDTPIINYLAAAQAAQAENALTRRDNYFGTIDAKGRLTQLAAGLTQAELQLQEKQYEQALATLRQLQHLAPKHPPVLRLLKNAYSHLQDWASLEVLLPSLEKYAVFPVAELHQLSVEIYFHLLKTASQQPDNSAELVWQRVPKHLRTHATLVEIYALYLTSKDIAAAENLLRYTLQKNFSPALVEMYGALLTTAPEKQLTVAEQWLSTYPQDAVLLLALGRLCLRNQLWGKARSYLESSLHISPRAVTCYVLGQLSEQLNEPEKALAYYRQGLALSEKSSSTNG